MSIGWIEISLLAVAAGVGAVSAMGLLGRERRLGLGTAALLLLTAIMIGHESALRAALDSQTADVLVLIVARSIGTVWWVVAAWLLVNIFETTLRRTIFPSAGRPRARKLFSDLFAGLVYLLALFGIVTFVFDEPLTGLVATSGVLAIVLGLALQSTLSDVFSGLALNIELPFRAGDWITVAGESEGQVIEINWRATRIQTRAGDLMIIPNSLMTKVRVTNHYPPSRGHVSTIRLELDGSIDPRTIIHALELAVGQSGQLSAVSRPRAVARRYGDAGIIYELYFTIEDFARAVQIESEVLEALWVGLGKAGIRSAQPLRDPTLPASRNVPSARAD
jgi:small-conductance mechanosensitive channel